MPTGQDVLNVAAMEIGYSRWNDPENGTKYGRWYANKVGDKSYAANGVPFCAMFVSWCMDKAGATAAGVPGAYCPSMLSAAKNAGKTVPVSQAQPGDIVYFDWDGGVPDHVGFVEKNCGDYLQTIEGNTDNGQVKRRTRAISTVCGIVRPNYTAATKPEGWVLNSIGWWWRNADGTWPANAWKQVKRADGKLEWFWFNKDGYCMPNCCLKINGLWFAFDARCAMIEEEIKISKYGNLILKEHKVS